MDDFLELYLSMFTGMQLIPNLISIASYVFLALGLSAIAERRGFDKPWLAWIPVANVWLLGSISDHYQKVVKNKITNRRKILVAMQIVSIFVMIVVMVVVVGLLVRMNITDPYEFANMSETELLSFVFSFIGTLGLVSMIAAVVSIVQAVFTYMCYYDLYVSCDPGSATLFLVLSIVVGTVSSFLVFAVREKDLGMYPQQPPQYQQPQYYQPPQYNQPPRYQPPQPYYQAPPPYQQPVQYAPPPQQTPPEDRTNT